MSKRKPSAPKPPAPAVVSASNFKRNASIGLFLLGALLYANTLFFDYAVDDAIVIYDNEFTCKGVAGFGGLLPLGALDAGNFSSSGVAVGTAPQFVYVSATRGIPPQANVIGSAMFALALLIVVGAQVVAWARRRSRA